MKQAIIFILFLPFTTIQTYILGLKNIFIAVKTTQKYEISRIPIILNTWYTLAKDQIWFFTDRDIRGKFWIYQRFTNSHFIATDCGSSHSCRDLCCKTEVELKIDLAKNNQIMWLCLFDDDNYVNVPNLVKELRKYDPKQDWYLGRRFHEGNNTSGMRVSENRKGLGRLEAYYHKVFGKYTYYGTLGAGVCLSRALIKKIQDYLEENQISFVKICDIVDHPDDVSLGYLIEHKLKVNLTHVPTLHSHLEYLNEIPTDTLQNQISFGYYLKRGNTVSVKGFGKKLDPTRFYSLHCFLGYCKEDINLNELLKIKFKN